MASAVVKYDAENSRFCAVCRKKSAGGRLLMGYGESEEFVCDSCYADYFEKTERDSGSFFKVRFRPVKVRKDEYRVSHIFARQLVSDMIMWVCAGAVLFAAVAMLCLVFRENGFNYCVLAAAAVYAVFSLVGALGAFRYFICGIFCGMDRKRILLLAVKFVLYTLICALCIYAVTVFWGMLPAVAL